MNANHLHLILNHLPVLGTAFGVALLVLGWWRASQELKKTAFGVFVLIALVAIPVYLTGEPSEKGIQALPGVSDAMMEQHEGAAGFAFTAVLLLGAAALAGLFLFRRGRAITPWFQLSVLAASLIVSGLMIWTANLGGQIRHSEIRSGSAASTPNSDRPHD